MSDNLPSSEDSIQLCANGIIVIFAKCPMPGSSKTRLESLLNTDGAALFAEAMLQDIICDITHHSELKSCIKIIVYAPGNHTGKVQMINIVQVKLGLTALSIDDIHIRLDSIKNDNLWYLQPMKSDKMTEEEDLISSDLGFKLSSALTEIRNRIESLREEHNLMKISMPIMFLGMDSPELPLDEFAQAMLLVSKNESAAYMNPAADGGYSMLMLPYTTPETVFDGIRWSCSLTAISQLKSLSDHGINTVIGSLMYDIDHSSDIYELSKRLCVQYDSRYEVEESAIQRHIKPDCLTAGSKQFTKPVFEKSQRRCINTFHILKKIQLIRPFDESETSGYAFGETNGMRF